MVPQRLHKVSAAHVSLWAAPDELAWPGLGGLLGKLGNTAAVIVTSSTKPSTSVCTQHHMQQGCIDNFTRRSVGALCHGNAATTVCAMEGVHRLTGSGETIKDQRYPSLRVLGPIWVAH